MFVFKTSSRHVFKTFPRYVFKTSSRHVFKTSSKHVSKTSSRRLQDVLQDVFKTCSRRLCKTTSRRLGRRKIVTLRTCWRRLQDQQMFAGIFFKWTDSFLKCQWNPLYFLHIIILLMKPFDLRWINHCCHYAIIPILNLSITMNVCCIHNLICC